jgi:hypothetical protein
MLFLTCLSSSPESFLIVLISKPPGSTVKQDQGCFVFVLACSFLPFVQALFRQIVPKFIFQAAEAFDLRPQTLLWKALEGHFVKNFLSQALR